MKKKLMFLVLGVVATCSVAFSQLSYNATTQGYLVNGQVNVAAGAVVNPGQVITFTPVGGGAPIQYVVGLIPSTNPPFTYFQAVADAFVGVFSSGSPTNVMVTGGGQFGTAPGYYTLNARLPFDFSILGVLFAGAFVAVATARKRRKEQLSFGV